MATDSGPFPQSALDANRAGQLSDVQRRWLRADARGVRKSELTVALFSAAFGIFLFFAVKPGTSGLVKVGIPIACLALAVFLVLRAITGGDRLTRDLRKPRVESVEGGISKHAVTSDSHGHSSTTYYLSVAGQRFKVWGAAYHAAPDAGFVRLYYLPISRHVVNLENLPDRSLPEGTTPQTMVQEFSQAVRSHDRAHLDEVRAEMAGTEHALQAAMSGDTTPPPEESRDQRPLAEAIQGTWSGGPITAVIGGDGTFTVTILGANQQSGTWSVGDDGKLMVDLGGRGGSTEAWIANDQLTVSLGDRAFTLRRVAGS